MHYRSILVFGRLLLNHLTGEENRLLVALAAGHALALAKLRVGEGGKVAAGEAGLGPGDRLS